MLRAETAKDLQGQLKTLKAQLDDPKIFKEVYKFTFNFAKDQGKRSLNFDNAKGKLFARIMLEDSQYP